MIKLLLIATILISSNAYAKIEKTKEQIDAMLKFRIEHNINNMGSKHHDLVEHSTYFFEKMEEGAVKYLATALYDENTSTRSRINILHTLGRLGKHAQKAVPVIMSSLRHNEPDVRAVANIAIGKIGKNTREAIPLLKRNMYHGDKWVSQTARSALLKINTSTSIHAVKSFDDEKIESNGY